LRIRSNLDVYDEKVGGDARWDDETFWSKDDLWSGVDKCVLPRTNESRSHVQHELARTVESFAVVADLLDGLACRIESVESVESLLIELGARTIESVESLALSFLLEDRALLNAPWRKLAAHFP
jgi:hypothetical protein